MSIAFSVDEVSADVLRLRYMFVNAYLVGTPERWILVDAIMSGAAGAIIEAAEDRFGVGTQPAGIVLTHAHFDHVGALDDLLRTWDVPVWVHPLELPHVTGAKDYDPPDPTVGKGAMALLSFAYPSSAIDLGDRVRALPLDHTVPYLEGWRWIHTPGHTGGHISLFREDDKVLIAGDAFVTVAQESLYQVMRQNQDVNGPPAYFTPDWPAAEESVRILANLKPAVAATGHGTPMAGDELTDGLTVLASSFEEKAIPSWGRYVPEES